MLLLYIHVSLADNFYFRDKKAEEEEKEAGHTTDNNRKGKRKAINNHGARWPDNTVYYKYGNSFSEYSLFTILCLKSTPKVSVSILCWLFHVL